MRASNSSGVSTFFYIAFHPSETSEREEQCLPDSDNSILVTGLETHAMWFFFSQRPILPPPKIFTSCEFFFLTMTDSAASQNIYVLWFFFWQWPILPPPKIFTSCDFFFWQWPILPPPKIFTSCEFFFSDNDRFCRLPKYLRLVNFFSDNDRFCRLPKYLRLVNFFFWQWPILPPPKIFTSCEFFFLTMTDSAASQNIYVLWIFFSGNDRFCRLPKYLRLEPSCIRVRSISAGGVPLILVNMINSNGPFLVPLGMTRLWVVSIHRYLTA